LPAQAPSDRIFAAKSVMQEADMRS
jgi:hypothetical protein